MQQLSNTETLSWKKTLFVKKPRLFRKFFLSVISLIMIAFFLTFLKLFPKLSFVCTRGTKISFKIFLLIKIIQILILIHPLQVTSGVKLPIGMNLPCPISSFLLLHLRFFSCSFDGKHCPMALDWHLEVIEPKVFTWKNAF